MILWILDVSMQNIDIHFTFEKNGIVLKMNIFQTRKFYMKFKCY